ncbi:esterase-like activity of phytase family protein [Aureimonas fodinaquatilis]|nr:esterase-like activity of phytase family protein [Aureimonas fodinaquatilis]
MRLTLFCLSAALVLHQPVQAAGKAVTVAATPIEQFRPGHDQTRFGAFDYIGGFSFRAPNVHGISGLRFLDNARQAFLSVSDLGYWFTGRIRRADDGTPIGIDAAQLAPILDRDGMSSARKTSSDAEGLAIHDGMVLVAFERDHRIEVFDRADPLLSRPLAGVPLIIPHNELRSNQGIEAVAFAPPGGALRGAAIAISEQSIDSHGNLFAAILGRPVAAAKGYVEANPDHSGIFTVLRQPPWHVTDAAFLPTGDLLLLERRYEGFGQLGMRLRCISGTALKPGRLVSGAVLMEVDGSYAIDNMEALDVAVDATGQIVIAIASDDNASFFQRNLYLEFRLAEDTPACPA